MDQAVSDSDARPRFEMLLLGLFGSVALILAAVGIYGVMNYSVARRTREIAVRTSLGANRSEIVKTVILQAMQQMLAGTAVGAVGAVLLSELMARMLFSVRPNDPATFIAVTIVLLLAALMATAIPARKAIKTDPMDALRSE